MEQLCHNILLFVVVRALALFLVCWICHAIFKKFDDIAALFRRSVAVGKGKDSFLYFISGQPVSLTNSEINWGWKGSQEVGSTYNFNVEVRFSPKFV